LLKIKNISFSYIDKKILSNVSVDFKSPGKYLILGDNGAGKSTLLNLLTGFLEPDSGSILCDNINVRNNNALSSLISYLPENYRLLNNFKIKTYLNFYNIKENKIFINLNLKTNANYLSLSQAYKQRVLLFLSLINKKYIFIDDLLKFQDSKNNILKIIEQGFEANTLIVCSPKIINDIKWSSIFVLQDGEISFV